MNCPVCGTEPTITEGRYISLLDGGELRHNELGKPGRGWGFIRDHDYISYPCGGFAMWIDENGSPQKQHLSEVDAL